MTIPGCRSCTAFIFWAVTEARDDKPAKPIPLDADPTDPRRPLTVIDGTANLVIVGSSPNGTPIARYVPKGQGRYRTHFATCPNAKTHRKG